MSSWVCFASLGLLVLLCCPFARCRGFNRPAGRPQFWPWERSTASQTQPPTTSAPTTTTATITDAPHGDGVANVHNCGVGSSSGDSQTRIVGGSAAAAGEFPWQVSIMTSFGGFCGGVIINNSTVLTAAHCVDYDATYSIGYGSVDRTTATDNGRSTSVSSVTVHPSYGTSSNGFENDIAILKLSTPLDLSQPSVNAVCLPSGPDLLTVNRSCEVTGWGAVSMGGSVTSTLQKVTVPLVDDATCSSLYRMDISNTRLCAGNVEDGGVDSCQGDSGGPLVCEDNGRYVLYGLVSSGVGCALPRYPGIYTEVSAYLKWIGQSL